MFLHSGASLHGHEYNRPSPTNTHFQRKKPFLRSALPAPILRSTTVSSTEIHSLPRSPIEKRRPHSEVYVRPISDLLTNDTPRPTPPTAPVVRFKDIDVVDAPQSSPMTEDVPSLYESDDASQATSSTPRRRRRRALPRPSTAYLLAVAPPKIGTTKALMQAVRPRLLLQLQELAANQRPKPSIDVFPASLMAGPLVSGRYIHRFPRLLGAKGELGPRDLILVKSENYTNDGDEEEESYSGRREPVAVLSRGRGPEDKDEIVLDDGTLWTCTSEKGYYSFVHVDEHGRSVTARWVKRSAPKRVLSAPVSQPMSPQSYSPSTPPNADVADSDSRYTFSIVNPLSRRHPVLATLTPQSLEIYDSYTTPSASQGRYPPSRPVSCILEPVTSRDSDPPPSPLSIEEPSTRETHMVDAYAKKLIIVTGLWLALRVGPTPDPPSETGASDSILYPQEPPMSIPSSTCIPRTAMPRRQTTSIVTTSIPPTQPTGLRRALSTGASFMQRRKQKLQQSPELASETNVEVEKMKGDDIRKGRDVDEGDVPGRLLPKQTQRLSWLKKLTH